MTDADLTKWEVEWQQERLDRIARPVRTTDGRYFDVISNTWKRETPHPAELQGYDEDESDVDLTKWEASHQ